MFAALVLAFALVAASAALSHGRLWQLPDRHNPFTPLRIESTPNWLTRHKLARLDEQPAACLEVLAQSAQRFEILSDREVAPGCALRNAVRIDRTQFQVGTPFTLTCPAAVSLALWERHVVTPAALALLGSAPQRLEHFGSLACRNVYGRENGRRSQHASAQALDVSGFVLADGRRITVARDWAGDDPEARFLKAVHGGACTLFDGVYGPAYNAAHADHFHLDRGPFRLCR